MGAVERIWNTRQTDRNARLGRVRTTLGPALLGNIFPAASIAALLHQVLVPGDRVCLEGNN